MGAPAELVDDLSGAGTGKDCWATVFPSGMSSESNTGTGVDNLGNLLKTIGPEQHYCKDFGV